MSQYNPMIDVHQWYPYGDAKHPINPNNGHRGYLTDPGCWEWATQQSDYTKGVGFCFVQKTPFFGFDIDLYKVVDDPELSEIVTAKWAELQLLSPSRRKSPSYPQKTAFSRGSVIASPETCALLGQSKCKILGGGIELFAERAYMRISFRPANTLPIAPVDDFIRELLELHRARTTPRLPASSFPTAQHVNAGTQGGRETRAPSIDNQGRADIDPKRDYDRIVGLGRQEKRAI